MSILSTKGVFYGKVQALRCGTEDANRPESAQGPEVLGLDLSRTRGQCRPGVPLARYVPRTCLSGVYRSENGCQTGSRARTHCLTGTIGWATDAGVSGDKKSLATAAFASSIGAKSSSS